MKRETSKTQGPRREKPLVLRILTGKLFLIAAFSIVFYTMAGFFLLPYVLKSQLSKYAAEDLDRTIQIDEIRFNPYVMTLDISNVELTEANGDRIMAFDRFSMDFELKSIFLWAWTFSDISLTGLVLQIDVAPDKTINLDRLFQDVSPSDSTSVPSKPEDESSLPRLIFERIQIVDGRIDLRDRSLANPAEIPISPINLTVKDLSTLPDRKEPYRFAARLPQDGILEWTGKISLQPIWSEGQFKLKNIQTKVAWDFLKERLNIEAPEGLLGVEGQYWFDYEGEVPQVRVSELGIQLEKLSLKVEGTQKASVKINSIHMNNGRFDLAKMDMVVGQLKAFGGTLTAAVEKDGRLSWEDILKKNPKKEVPPISSAAKDNTPPFQIHMEKIELSDIGLKFEDHSRVPSMSMDLEDIGISLKAEAKISSQETLGTIDEIDIDLEHLLLGVIGEPEDLLTLPQVRIRGGQVDLASRRISFKDISFKGGDMSVWRTRKGAINLVQLSASGNEGAIRREITKVQEAAEAQEHPWSVYLETIQMEGFGLKLSDRGLQTPERYQLENITLQVRDFQTPPKDPFDFNLAFNIAEGGKTEIKGQVDIRTPKATLSVQADGVALTPLKPYLKDFVTLSLDSGNAFVKGDMDYKKSQNGEDVLNFRGSGGIKELALIREQSGKTFLSWDSLDLQGIQLGTLPRKVLVEKVFLNNPVGQFVINKDGSLNLQDVLVSSRKNSNRTTTVGDDTPSKKKEVTTNFPFEINEIRIKEAELDFADLSLIPPFGTKIDKLSGIVNGLSSAPDKRTVIALEGRVDQYGSAKIKGELAPLDAKGYSDVAVIFRNVEMTSLTPYSAKFAGRRIESGKISLDLNYKIVDSRLKGENQIIVDSLELGERVEGSDSTDLPLDLAIALMKDANDRIQLGLPVAGSLDDPEFSYGHLVWKALANVLTKIVTAPFRALASLVGHDDEDLDTVNFEVGRMRITPPEAEKLAKLANAIQQRPQLTMEVQGRYAPDGDGMALKHMIVRQTLAKQMGKTHITDLNLDMEPLNTTDSATRKALDTLAGERMDAAVLTTLKKTYGLQPPQPQATEGIKKKPTPKTSSTPPKPDMAGFYEALFQNLVELQPVSENELTGLARKRAQAVISELTTAGGIKSGQLTAIESNGEGQAEGGMVAIHLNLTAKEK